MQGNTSIWFLAAFAAYTALLFLISWLTGRKAGTRSFFSADRKAPWPVVAYGMVGSSVTGVTFISVPGNVWVQDFFYLPMVLGFVVGYIVIAKLLLPLYYRMNLTSIYSYLDGLTKGSEDVGTLALHPMDRKETIKTFRAYAAQEDKTVY